MKIQTSPLILLTLIPALLLVGNLCSLTNGKEIGKRAVVQFHKQFNAGQAPISKV